MNECYVKCNKLNLYYPSDPYNSLTLKETIFNLIKGKKPKKRLRDVHALKDINISISEGERVGIIGANGSGKSTLLKTIAGIYPCTSGTIETLGEIRSLFELSLGFDYHATGRENIEYRSLLLGAHPKLVKERTQDIIDFADIGEFIDYPIKSYSSGMLIRLAFSISTTIKGDIILLDETLGAGDAAFMIKVKQRINEIVENAKVLVIVSHDFNTIKSICNRAIWLNKGSIMMDGNPEEIIEGYLKYSYNK